MCSGCQSPPSQGFPVSRQFLRSSVLTVVVVWRPAGSLLTWRSVWVWGGTPAGWPAGDWPVRRAAIGREATMTMRMMTTSGLNLGKEIQGGREIKTHRGDFENVMLYSWTSRNIWTYDCNCLQL